MRTVIPGSRRAKVGVRTDVTQATVSVVRTMGIRAAPPDRFFVQPSTSARSPLGYIR